MNLSIIIPVKDDLRIKNAIDSIDENVEIVIVLNIPSKEIRLLTKKLKNLNANIKITEIGVNNLSKAYNVGIKSSTKDNVLLMDSDCVFKKNTIRKLFEGLKNCELSKGRVSFKIHTFINKIIALSRDYHATDIVNAYSPPLAFKKSIKNKIGGYFFDEEIYWTEDHEFNQRVKRARFKIAYNPKAIIKHKALTIKADLRSSFFYGMGYYQGVSKGKTVPSIMYGGHKTLFGSIIFDLFRIFLLPLFFLDVFFKKGFFTAIYMLIWMFVFVIGYYTQGFFKKLE